MFKFLVALSPPDECVVDDDCPASKACRKTVCVDPCLETSCGDRAVCEVHFHHPRCICPPGLQGNPIVRCFDVGCLRDDDCGGRERCDYPSQECIPLCRGQVCHPNARCEAENHRESCVCDPPREGDGWTYCDRRKGENK